MDKNLLVRLFGFPATLIHGNTAVIDRWHWLKGRLPTANRNLRLLDVGCGTGAFTIGLALRGYETLGLSWNVWNQKEAARRAKICKADSAKFEIQDARLLNERYDLIGKFDIVICLELIEHIINDKKLMQDLSACLKSTGKLLLTSPNYNHPDLGILGKIDDIISQVEDGGHVRIGYTKEDLERLCEDSGLHIDEISFCCGFLSQKITSLMMLMERIHPLIGWACILPLRPFPIFFDGILAKLFRWPGYCICLVAHKD